jgi:hypothetical protein
MNNVIRCIIKDRFLDSNTPEVALDNEDVALAVAQYCPDDYIKLSKRLRSDKQLIMLVLQNIHKSIEPEGPQPIELASNDLKDDIDVATLSIQKNPCSIQWLSGRLSDNEVLAELAMTLTPMAYPGLSLRLRERHDYIASYVLAVENCRHYCYCPEEYLPDSLKKHVEINDFSTHTVKSWILNNKLEKELRINSRNIKDIGKI